MVVVLEALSETRWVRVVVSMPSGPKAGGSGRASRSFLTSFTFTLPSQVSVRYSTNFLVTDPTCGAVVLL